MERKQLLISFWQDVAAQDKTALKAYFTRDAYIRWNNTNEQFTVDEYIVANCEYPGDWQGSVERIETAGPFSITVTRVWPTDCSASFHAVSFFEFEGNKIKSLSEYWGDDGPPPQWRQNKHIGKPIQ